MRKIVVLFCLFIFVSCAYARVQVQRLDNFNNMMDSLLFTFGQKIENDLALEGFSVPVLQIADSLHAPIGLGQSLLLEVFFVRNNSWILASSDSTWQHTRRHRRQDRRSSIRTRLYFDTFLRYIQENNRLPYDFIEYFSYKFLTPLKNSQKDYMIYGKYRFKANRDGTFEIVEKKIEFLQSRSEISRALSRF